MMEDDAYLSINCNFYQVFSDLEEVVCFVTLRFQSTNMYFFLIDVILLIMPKSRLKLENLRSKSLIFSEVKTLLLKPLKSCFAYFG